MQALEKVFTEMESPKKWYKQRQRNRRCCKNSQDGSPANNGVAEDGTAGGVPAVNGTAGGVPASNSTSDSVPGLTGDFANNSYPDSAQRQSNGRLGSSSRMDRVTDMGTPYQESLNANATVFTPGYQQTPRVEQLIQAPTAENLLVTALGLPQPEVPKFSGCIADYRMFTMAFDARVSLRTIRCADRLYYLHQHLIGELRIFATRLKHLKRILNVF